jgi:hypothetical protein
VSIQRRTFLSASSSLLVTTAFGVELLAESADILVPVVAQSSPVTDISMGTLRRVFLGEPVNGPGGTRFVGFNQPPKTRPRTSFDQVVLGMNPDEAARYWVDQRIRGGARPPRTVANVALLRQVVSQFPGAISYLAMADVDPSVRAVSIGGVSADSSHYPLR